MSDIEYDEYEIMEVQSNKDSQFQEIESPELPESTEVTNSTVPTELVECQFSMNELIANPKTEYVIKESAGYTFSKMNGSVKYTDCPGTVEFSITTNHRETFGLFGGSRDSPVKMELTLSSKKDVSNIKFISQTPADTDEIEEKEDKEEKDESMPNVRVITFNCLQWREFTISADVDYEWKLRPLIDVQFTFSSKFKPDFLQIVKQLKTNELKSTIKRKLNNTLQRIYVDQLKKDGNYYCNELRTAKDRINHLNVELSQMREYMNTVEDDCETTHKRFMTIDVKYKSQLAELTNLKNELNRMKFLKEFYVNETKISKDKCLTLTSYISDLTTKKNEECDKLKNEHTDLTEKYDNLNKIHDELKEKYENLTYKYEDMTNEYEKEYYNLLKSGECVTDELNELKYDYELKVADYESLKTEYKDELNYANEKYDSLETEHNQLLDDFESLDNDFDELEDDYFDLKDKYTKLKNKQSEIDDGIDELDEIDEQDKQANNVETLNKINNEMAVEIDQLKSEVKRLKHLEKDINNYKKLAEQQYDKIKNLEIQAVDINQANNEKNKTLKEQVTFLESDNKYLKDVLFKVQQDYKNMKNKKNGEAWTYETKIIELKEEIASLKKKRIHKKTLEEDIIGFSKRSADIISWGKSIWCPNNEIDFFKKEVEIFSNDILDYFRNKLELDTSG